MLGEQEVERKVIVSDTHSIWEEVITMISFFRAVALVIEVTKLVFELLKMLKIKKDKPLT